MQANIFLVAMYNIIIEPAHTNIPTFPNSISVWKSLASEVIESECNSIQRFKKYVII